MFLSQTYPLNPTLPEGCTGLSYRTFFNWGISRSAWVPVSAVWGHVQPHAEAGDTVVLPLPSSHNPPNLGIAVRTQKNPRHTKYTLSGQEFCSLPPELFWHMPISFERIRTVVAKLYVWSIFLKCMQHIPPIQICQHWLPKALATPKCHHNTSNSLSDSAI